MMRLPVRSRRWNLVLAVLGSIYTVSAVVLLVWYTREVWNAEGITDRLFQIALLFSAVCGACLALGAANNLGFRGHKPWQAQRVNRATART
jgi:hypothetical protein